MRYMYNTYIYIVTVLLRYNYHTINYIYLNHRPWYVLTMSTTCEIGTTVKVMTHPSLPEVPSCPFCSSFFSSVPPWTSDDHWFSLHYRLAAFSRVFYKWNHTIYILFLACLLSLRVTILSFIHVVTCLFPCMTRPRFVCSSIDGRLHGFQFGAVTNKATGIFLVPSLHLCSM